MTLPTAPYDSFVSDHDDGWDKLPPTKRTVAIKARVLEADKCLLLTIIPDRGLYNLIIQHAIKRTADFARKHELSYNDADQRRLLDYITAEAPNTVRKSATARAPRDTAT